MKKRIKIVLICLCVFVFAVAAHAKTEVTLNIITAPEVPEFTQKNMIARISSMPAYKINTVYIPYDQKKHPELTVLPAYYFSKELVKEPQTFRILKNGRLITENWKAFRCLTYQIPPNTYECGIYINKIKKGQMELFYRPFCPYGVKALIALLDYHQQNPKIISSLNVVPLVKEKEMSFKSSKISLHQRYEMPKGFMELKETVRQLVIYEYFPEKLLPYLKYRKKNNIRLPYWQDAAEKAGLIPETVSELCALSGEMLLARGIETRSRYPHISASPTYVWQNKYCYNYTSELLQQPIFKDLKIDIGNNKSR
ncbi:hypothetical protein ACFL57_02090 [Candidatus Margulisiibacteriota bacterium]